MRSSEIPQALNILEENKYRNDNNYFRQYHRNKLEKINKWSMIILTVMKISCISGCFLITFMTIEWNIQRWLIIIFNDLPWCIFGFIGMSLVANALLVIIILFLQVNACYGVYFEAIQANISRLGRRKKSMNENKFQKKHQDLLTFSYAIIESVKKAEIFFNFFAATYFFSNFFLAIFNLYSLIFIQMQFSISFIQADSAAISFILGNTLKHSR